mmetsp:Transcript_1892/g.3029  ORF Transcript_1892/g.3029 Transcript_1892/m.3029 type:complete len:241 (+) Transcript_1892:3-725(+)
MTPEEKAAADRAARNSWEYPAANELRKLRGDVKALLRTQKGTRTGKIRQQLTYKVLKDELVHARLKEQVAVEKATENQQKEQMDEQALRDTQQREKKEVSELNQNMSRLQRKLKKLAKEHRRHMSSSEAQKDLNSYFADLSSKTAESEVSRYQKKLARLRAKANQLEGGSGQQLRQHQSATRSQRAQKKQSKLSQGMKGVKQQLATADRPAKQQGHDDLKELVDGLVRNSAPYLPGVPGI